MAKNRSPEHDLQVACVKWFRLAYAHKIIFAIPNGGKRNIGTAMKLRAEGVLAGTPDLFIPEANNGYHGLFIEMKAGKGTLSDNQKVIIPMLIEKGYQVEVVRSAEEFIEVVNSYLKNKGE